MTRSRLSNAATERLLKKKKVKKITTPPHSKNKKQKSSSSSAGSKRKSTPKKHITKSKKRQSTRKLPRRTKQIRISRDVRVTYYTRYRKGMTSTLLKRSEKCQLFESNYRTYVSRLLKHVHRGMQISKESLDQMNGFVNYLFHSVAYDAAILARGRKQKTITGKAVQDAIIAKFPGNIKIFAVMNGIETLNKFIVNKKK